MQSETEQSQQKLDSSGTSKQIQSQVKRVGEIVGCKHPRLQSTLKTSQESHQGLFGFCLPFSSQMKCTLISLPHCHWGLAWWLSGKEFTCSAGDGDPGSIPGSGRSPGKGNGNTLQYSFLENPIDRRAWWATVLGVAKSRAQVSKQTAATLSLVHTACGRFVLCKKQGKM